MVTALPAFHSVFVRNEKTKCTCLQPVKAKAVLTLGSVALTGRSPWAAFKRGTFQPLRDSLPTLVPAKEPLTGIYGLVSQANFELFPNLRV